MKDKITSGMLHVGTGVSCTYVLALGIFLLAPHIHGALFRSVQAAGLLALLASPLACLVSIAALPCAFLVKSKLKKRLAFAALNGTGVFISGWFTWGLLHLWKMGPINPG